SPWAAGRARGTSSERPLAAHGDTSRSRDDVAGDRGSPSGRRGGKQQLPLAAISPVETNDIRASLGRHVGIGSRAARSNRAVSIAAPAASTPLLEGPGWARSTA